VVNCSWSWEPKTAYPDSDEIAVWTGYRSENVFVERSSNVDYYAGEVESGS
jgi:hypothetical protein